MLLIDGYNLLFASRRGRIDIRELSTERERLLNLLQHYCRLCGKRGIVIFDHTRAGPHDIDDLQGVVDATISSRQERVPEADQIISEETERFWEWYLGRRVVDVVRALRNNAEHIRLQELQRAMKKLGHLSPQDREQVEYLTKALLQKFLHTPTIRLRGATGNGTDNDIAEALRYAFDLSDRPERDKETEEGEME